MKFIDIHTHGGFGIDFATCDTEGLQEFSKKALGQGIVGFCPTLATDTFENIQRQLNVIAQVEDIGDAKILGAHLEGIFLNPEKAGAHNKAQLNLPTIENFKKAVGDFMDVVKIVTLAPELDENLELTKFLQSNGIKVHAGHTLAKNAKGVDGTTHHFNAMPKMSHNEDTITLDAIMQDDIYTEIIADGVHVDDEMLNLFFRIKNPDKVILISDSLALAGAIGGEFALCGKKVFATNEGARNEDGTLAGSILLLGDIVKRLTNKGILPIQTIEKMVWDNPIKHLGLDSEAVENMIKLGKNNE